MPSLDEKIQQLAAAQHRRLLAINQEIRKASKLPHADGRKTIVTVLKARRKQHDQTYSAILRVQEEQKEDLKKIRYEMMLSQYNRG